MGQYRGDACRRMSVGVGASATWKRRERRPAEWRVRRARTRCVGLGGRGC
ncbi:hypothetical protein BURPS668_A3203 [Burkholderia pseudomallei 668]|nr:hypothetical protein BURPS668_A3203 [Burkholderia pseudomallei 668]